MTGTVASPAVDGRTLRAQRTRAGILDAHIRLIDAGVVGPPAEQIASHAGVSVRSIWLHFPDRESLAEATAAAVIARQDDVFRPVDVGLPLAGRIDAYCAQRADLLERIGPMARASAVREPFSPVLRAYRRLHVLRVADEVDRLFAVELGRAGDADRPALRAALVAASTWGAWATLRDDLDLDPDRARDALRRGVHALLDPFDRPDPHARSDPSDPTDPHAPPDHTGTTRPPGATPGATAEEPE